MSVNYSLLKESEMEIMNEFKEFYNYIMDMNLELYKYLQSSHLDEKWVSDDEYDSIKEMLNKSEILKSDLVSNCIWVIQKNEPRASHLRFVIAIVYATKNLLNISNNTRKIARFFNKTKISIDLFNVFLNLYKDTMNLSKKIFDILFDKKIIEKTKPIEENSNKYHLAVKNIFKDSNDESSDECNFKDKDVINFFINIGRLERIIDHQEDILKDFNYIK